MRSAIVIFSRVPLPGKTKTRLMKVLTPKDCAALHQACLIDIGLEILKLNIDCYLYFTGGNSDQFQGIELSSIDTTSHGWLEKVCSSLKLRQQLGNDLGQRLSNAAQDLMSEYDKVIFIGADLPTISAKLILDALNYLDHHDLVIGPSRDGGYYLIGMKKNHYSIFENVPWGTADVLKKSIKNAKEDGLTSFLLETLFDIDTWQDLICFYHETINNNVIENKSLYSFRLAEKMFYKYAK